MDTYFAPPEKANDKEIAAEIEIVNKNPVMSGLLNSISGILAILDENRQIIALNDSFLKTLGIDDPEQALGLRLGEALECIHANEEPAGCGTTKFCSTCGAAIAIVSSIEQDIPMERLCALSANKGGINIDIVLLVKSQPIKIENRNYILLFIQDITKQEQRAALERAFYHDINNMLSMLVMASELLIEDYPSKLSKTI
ncbi:MAG: sensor histidine kinase, partial [Proteobacteria bacterium]|nr:sensor histidine kinase [Pseudomonadota bacterium]